MASRNLISAILFACLFVFNVHLPSFEAFLSQDQVPSIKILALFSESVNDLGIDFRLGRQVLRVASQRAKQLNPRLEDIELIFVNDSSDCSSLNSIPEQVARYFYSDQRVCVRGENSSKTCDKMNQLENTNTELKLLANYINTNQSSIFARHKRFDEFIDRDKFTKVTREASILAEPKSARLNKRQSIDVIIGPSCKFLVDIVARMAAYWRAPIYSVAAISSQFSQKSIFTTLTRLSPSIDHVSMFILRTMERYNWRHLSIILDDSQVDSKLIYDNLELTISRSRFTIPVDKRRFYFDSFRSSKHHSNNASSQDSQSSCSRDARETLLAAKRTSRVFLLLLNEYQIIRRLLICAYDLGFNNGEYTFMVLNLGLNSGQLDSDDTNEGSKDLPDTQSRSSQSNGRNEESDGATGTNSKVEKSIDWHLPGDDKNNAKARKMFESLLVYSAELPISREFDLFVEQVLEGTKRDYPKSKFESRHIGPLAIGLHDSLLIAVEAYMRQYQRALNTEATRLEYNRNRQVNQVERTTTESNVDSMDRYSIYGMSQEGEIDLDMQTQGQEAALFWNETFYDGLLANLHINSNGDQELTYILSDLEPELAFMRPVASYSRETRQLYMFPNSYIHWPTRLNALTKEPVQSDEAPPDEPECGFNEDAEQCIDRQNLYVALTIASAVAMIVSFGVMFGVFKYRQIKYQLQLDDYWWQIEWIQLQFIASTNATDGSHVSIGRSAVRAMKSHGSLVGSHVSGASNLSKQKVPLVPDVIVTDNQEAHEAATKTNQAKSGEQATTTQSVVSGSQCVKSQIGTGTNAGAYTIISDPNLRVGIKSMFSNVVRESSLALYKEELVIVKLLNCDSIEISRELLVDLKAMRDHLSDNLAKFMGLCVEPTKLSIVYEFCSRGSLQDMLLNDSFDMDWTLKYSIMGDILNGLNYIQTTQLEYHGRLKSTNLVLDSRFTVKITDFGLQSLYSQIDTIEDNNQADGDDGESAEIASASECQSIVPRDTLSISVSQVGFNQQRSGKGSVAKSREARDSEAVKRNRANYKGRRSARFLWTAPEHMRSRETYLQGSKRGDVYSLGIIFSEIFTRREPYHFGSNARPNWQAIKTERNRLASMRRHSSAVSQANSRPTSDTGSNHGSIINRGARQVGNKLKKLTSVVSPSGVSNTIDAESGSVASTSDQGSVVSRGDHASGSHLPVSRRSSHRTSRVGISDEEIAAHIENDKLALGNDANSSAGQVDVEEILDQIRMGIQPEPVRPYLPNFLIQDIDPKLIELMRNCWAESGAIRPNITRVRSQLKAITKGQTAKNYLDNLLDRLQKYASDLERILDEKSGDIVGEKQKTEQILYQLVPRFVADRLKRDEPIIPQLFDCVTIYFSDIINFEKYATMLSPVDLVQLLSSLYFSFDSIIDSFDVTKIETIIDIYLIASGLKLDSIEAQVGANKSANELNNSKQDNEETQEDNSNSKSKSGLLNRKILSTLRSKSKDQEGNNITNQDSERDNGGDDQTGKSQDNQMQISDASSENLYTKRAAEQIARMALSIRDMIISFRFNPTQSQYSAPINLNVRMGIHSGRVCAGIVGVKRPKFCLIGDTVNVASRMHTNSKANKIQISSSTRQLLDQVSGFDIQSRGKIEVKGKGQMDTFWLEYAR